MFSMRARQYATATGSSTDPLSTPCQVLIHCKGLYPGLSPVFPDFTEGPWEGAHSLCINVCNMDIITGPNHARYSIMAAGLVDHSDQAGGALAAPSRASLPWYIDPVFTVDIGLLCKFFGAPGKAPCIRFYTTELP
jgi:hypothetical protein